MADSVVEANAQQPALNGTSLQGQGAVPQLAPQDAAATATVPATAVVQQGRCSAVAPAEQPASRTAGLASLLTSAQGNGQPKYVFFKECTFLTSIVHSGNLKHLQLRRWQSNRSQGVHAAFV